MRPLMVENAHRHLSEGSERMRSQRIETIIRSAKQVGPAIFGSLLVMIVSFLPVFLLTGQEGKLFRPLAFTKTFAMLGASILAITLVPALMTFSGVVACAPSRKSVIGSSRRLPAGLKWSLHNARDAGNQHRSF